MNFGKLGENGFDVLVNCFGGVIFFFSPKLGMTVLDILTDHNEGQKKKLNDVADKNHKYEWKRIERFFGNSLPEHPAKNKDDEEIKRVHGTYSCSDDDSYPILKLETVFVLGVDILRSVAGFEIVGETFGH